jgi:hypothetical protein
LAQGAKYLAEMVEFWTNPQRHCRFVQNLTIFILKDFDNRQIAQQDPHASFNTCGENPIHLLSQIITKFATTIKCENVKKH